MAQLEGPQEEGQEDDEEPRIQTPHHHEIYDNLNNSKIS